MKQNLPQQRSHSWLVLEVLSGSKLPPEANLVVLGLGSAGITNLAVILDQHLQLSGTTHSIKIRQHNLIPGLNSGKRD